MAPVHARASASFPPGLDRITACEADNASSSASAESRMRELVKASDHAGVLGILASAENINSRCANMALQSLIASGASVDAAATEVCRMCAKRQIRPTREIFNNILGYLTKDTSAGSLENVRRWLSRMRDAGIQPDTWACNILLKAMLLAGDWTAAAGLLSGMTHEHAAATAAAAAAIPTDGSPPQDAPYPVDSSNSRDPHKLPPADAVTFNTAISGLGIAHRPQQAEAVLNHMLDAGFNADTTSFTATISAYSRAQRPADGTRTHHQQQHGSPPGARLLFSPPPPPPALSDPLRNKPATQLIPPSPFLFPACVSQRPACSSAW